MLISHILGLEVGIADMTCKTGSHAMPPRIARRSGHSCELPHCYARGSGELYNPHEDENAARR